ncbi:hypothetical protein P8C59_004963 [Phyllachora maydis]|uniref:Chromatin modification-related protein EAF6 n=1 Tax=Phyllachora maydis TaxID=1825666 RepID=A0AAD9I3E1_9PEZI|nr:hypothetical protein P8C59_004963 [Phyllachora maydis]
MADTAAAAAAAVAPAAKSAGGGGNDAATTGPVAAAAAGGGQPFYDKQRAHLKDLIARRRALDKRLQASEDDIYQKETEYLESTPHGNIITGFDSYTKGAGTTAAAQRRRMGLTDQNRVFSRSSVSYNPNSEGQTPASSSAPPGSLAPTPLSTAFANHPSSSGGAGGPSAAGTPTSTTVGAGTVTKGGERKKTKRAASAAVAAAGEESETEGKKVRTAFGAARKASVTHAARPQQQP